MKSLGFLRLGALTLAWVLFACGAVESGPTPSTGEAETPESFPEHPVTIIVPRGPGGGSHQLCVTMAKALAEELGVEVEVVNKPGREGVAAIEEIMTMPANGYTILQHVDDVASLFAEGKIAVDPTSDLIPIAIVQRTFSQIYVRTLETRFDDWSSLVDHAKANPGELKVATVGEKGSMEDLLLGGLEEVEGFASERLRFNKPTERYLALVKGEADALIEQPGDVRPFLDRKLIKPVLTLLPEASDRFPEAKSLADVPGEVQVLYRFRGFFVHGQTPEDRAHRLEDAMKKAFDSELFQEFNKSKYMDLLDSYYDSAGAQALIKETEEVYRKLDG